MGSRIRSMSAVTQEPRTSTFRSGTWTCSTRQQRRLDCAMPYTKAVMAGAGHVGQTAKETRLARTHREGSFIASPQGLPRGLSQVSSLKSQRKAGIKREFGFTVGGGRGLTSRPLP